MIDQPPILRYFLRCRGCLSVMAWEGSRPPARVRCSACEGGIEVMGVVQRHRVVRMEDHTPCDSRCTMASGPSCNCQCGGKNHGTKITVRTAVDVGGIPRITPPDPVKARRVHGEWLKARQEAEARVRRFFPGLGAVEAGTSSWEASQAFRARRYMDAIDRAGALRTHGGRLKALEKMNEDLTKGSR